MTRSTGQADAAPHRGDGSGSDEEDAWRQEFDAAARRLLAQRVRYSFIKTYKPVLDDAPFRSFDTMEEYRRWCERELPSWLGYARV